MDDRELFDAAVSSTVRVNTAGGVLVSRPSGRVILTAAHVVPDELATIRWPGGETKVFVLHRSQSDDIAVLADEPRIMPGVGLELVREDPEPGESFVHAGFPGGWPERSPLVCPGHIAGLTPGRLWLNVDGTWGQSGGPVVVRDADRHARVATLVLGRAGEPHPDLEAQRRYLEDFREKLKASVAQVRRELELPTADRMTVADFERLAMGRDLVGLVISTMRSIDHHFRSGFLEAPRLGAIQTALGNGA